MISPPGNQRAPRVLVRGSVAPAGFTGRFRAASFLFGGYVIQLGLMLPLPRARRTDPQTSHAAAAKAASIAPSQRNIIAAALSQGPATVKTISDRCGLSQYAVSKRLKEMQELGIIELTGREIDGCREWRKA